MLGGQRFSEALARSGAQRSDAKMFTVYQIDCEDQVVYIGMTCQLDSRIAKHFAGQGAAVTRRHKPVSYKVLDVFETAAAAKQYERIVVHDQRKQNVRTYGAGFTFE